MNKIKNSVPISVLKIIYNSLILPHINYGLKCWGFCGERILKLQKRAVRIMTLSHYRGHSNPLFKKTKYFENY